MTLREAMTGADRLAGNEIPAGLKVRWLSELDGTLYREILCRHRGSCGCFRGYDDTTDPDTRLLAEAPYDGLYRIYMEMQIHDANGEIQKYNNAAQKFNAALLTYGDYINRSRMPLGAAGLKLV